MTKYINFNNIVFFFFLALNNNNRGIVSSFTIPTTQHRDNNIILNSKKETSTYDETDVSSKGFVSGLTGFVNMFFPKEVKKEKIIVSAASSPTELMERIASDYTERNYLWTGDIDLDCFDSECEFTDPTISFTSTDTFVKNTQNLKTIVDKIAINTQSKLLNITTNDGYVESRWNMIGDLTGLPWKPRINVIGRTKFWYKPVDTTDNNTNDDKEKEKTTALQVYFYDESWEIPASQALLQLFKPGVY